MGHSGAGWKLIHKKTRSKKSHDTVPLRSFRIFSKIRGDIRESRCITSINNTGGKFATGVNDTGGKIAAGNDTGGKIAAGINDKFATGVNDTGGKFFHHFR